MRIDRIPQERKHFDAVYAFFEGTVADIILAEISVTQDGQLKAHLQQQGNRLFADAPDSRVARELQAARDALAARFPVELLWGEPGTGLARAIPSSATDSCNYIVLADEVRSLPDAALRFVIAHELAHIGYRHGVLRWIVQTVYPGRSAIPPYLSNEYDVWSRCAELSADRAAFFAVAGDSDRRCPEALGAGETVLGRLPVDAEPNPQARLRCLREPRAIDDVYSTFLNQPRDEFAGQLVRFIIAAGELLANVDGEYLSAERSFLVNRVSRHTYAGALGTKTDRQGDPWTRVLLTGRGIRDGFPGRVREAFLNLAILVVRDGKVTRDEYESLVRVGDEVLGLDADTIRGLLLRVFRSDYYQPFQE